MSSVGDQRQWVLDCGARYWPRNADAIDDLPMPKTTASEPGALVEIALPDWAGDLAVGGGLLTYSGALIPGPEAEPWRRCDWLAVAWHMLSGSAERNFEAQHGPALSYAFRLPKEMHALFERAWVNRIFLFLRRWAAREKTMPEEQLFGPLPHASIILTHDVDAITLTPEIRAKQTAFQLWNAARATARGEFGLLGSYAASARRFALSRGDFRTLARVREMETAAGLRSILHFYGGPPGLRRGSPRRVLLDPAYDVGSPYVRGQLAAFREGGWTIGLHQSFDAWTDPAAMAAERRRVAEAAEMEITHCRQHWLHFSWVGTWAAQEAAGLSSDSTLGFNDRPGFRAGHGLRFHPWDFQAGRPTRIEATPMLFMDSHFYDYGRFGSDGITSEMKRWLDEVRAVRGEVTVNWHTHTITDVYGWNRGFEELLGLLA